MDGLLESAVGKVGHLSLVWGGGRARRGEQTVETVKAVGGHGGALWWPVGWAVSARTSSLEAAASPSTSQGASCSTSRGGSQPLWNLGTYTGTCGSRGHSELEWEFGVSQVHPETPDALRSPHADLRPLPTPLCPTSTVGVSRFPPVNPTAPSPWGLGGHEGNPRPLGRAGGWRQSLRYPGHHRCSRSGAQ